MTRRRSDPRDGLARVLCALDPVRDILDERVGDAAPPRFCVARGWAGFLLALDDESVQRAEADGLAAVVADLPGAPDDLVALASEVTRVTRLPALAAAPRPLSTPSLREIGARKRQQLEALLGALGPMAERAERIVDVGAGSGHFSRLAADLFAREVLAIERDPARVLAAERRAREHGAASARFVAADAIDEPTRLGPTDLAVGLHACGELGDRLVLDASRAGCDLALVSCCLQKIGAPARAPLSEAAAALSLRREILGLTNLTSQPRGVETSIEATMAAREARHALLLLLRSRGVALDPGEEMRGVNRRRARAGLAEIAALALALRGLPPATAAEIAEHEREARRRYALVRRFSLPRSMLARLVEVAVVLDRAAALSERGAEVVVATITPRAATPRNLAIFASGDGARLPEVAISS